MHRAPSLDDLCDDAYNVMPVRGPIRQFQRHQLLFYLQFSQEHFV